MIQAVVTRMANHSFLLKGWSVTLSAALFALAAKDSVPQIIWIALIPIAAFWALDAFYLRQERLYRALYDQVRKEPSGESGELATYSMSTGAISSTVTRWEQTLFAPSVIGLHGSIAAIALIIIFTSDG